MRKNQFEKLIESIINEDEKAAKEIFHQIVVEQSRKIYEGLQDEELGGEDLGDEIEADHDVIDGDENGDDFGGEEDFGGAGDELGGDEFGGEESEVGEEGLEDRVMDLEDALDELKAEFDALMSAEEGEEEHADDFGGDDLEGEEGSEELEGEIDATDDAGEFDIDDEGDEEEVGFGEASVYGKQPKTAGETMREYVEKVTKPNMSSEGGEIGASGKSVPVNKKSINISGKNDMGGTTANIAKGGSEQAPDGKPTPKPSNAYSKGQKEQEGASSWENRPGANTKGYKDKKSAKTSETGVNDKSIEPGGKPGFKG